MNDRLRQQEKYTRKDNVLIRNSPFDGRDEKLLDRNVVKFFVAFLKIECFDRGGSKALLYVPKRKPLPYKLMPTVWKIFKYFDKDFLHNERKNLQGQKTLNGRQLYIDELLLPEEAKLKRETDENCYVTSATKFKMSVLCKSRDGREVLVPIN